MSLQNLFRFNSALTKARAVLFGMAAVVLPIGLANGQGTITITDPTAPIGGGGTTIGQTSNGTTSIGIATPGQDGTSMNTFGDFNVDENGVIISNNENTVQSVNGGTVAGNSNLAGGNEAATIILSVTGVNQSVIEGWLEIAGQDADLIIANQNGLSCNGCSFYNVNDLTLAAASAEVLSNGQVAVTTKGGSRLVIGREGLHASGASSTTLVGSSVSIDGEVNGGQSMTIVGGSDTTVNVATGEVSGGGVNSGVVAVDATEYGAMTAGQITIIGTDLGMGVRSAGTISATGQENFEEDDDGNLVGDGQGSITIVSAGDASIQSAEAFGSDVTVDAEGDVTLEGDFYASSGVQISGENVTTTEDFAAMTLGEINIEADQTANVGGELTAVGDLAISGASVTANDGVQASYTGDITITATNVLTLSNVTLIGDAVVVDGATVLKLDQSYISARDSADVSGGTLEVAGGGGKVGDEILSVTTGDGNVLVSGLFNTASIDILGMENVSVSEDGLIYGEEGLELNFDSLLNKGQVISGADLSIDVASLTNQGLIQAGGDLTITAEIAELLAAKKEESLAALVGNTISLDIASNLLNGGLIQAAENLSVDVIGDFSNDGALVAVGDITILASNYTSGSDSAIQGANIDMSVTGALANAGSILGQSIALTAGTDLLNSGAIQAIFATDEDGEVIEDEDGLLIGGTVSLTADVIRNDGAVISTWYAGLNAREIHNGAQVDANPLSGMLKAQVLELQGEELISNAGYIEGGQRLILQAGGQGIVWDTDGDGEADRTWKDLDASELPQGLIVLKNGSTTLGSAASLTAGDLVMEDGSTLRGGEGGLSLTLTRILAANQSGNGARTLSADGSLVIDAKDILNLFGAGGSIEGQAVTLSTDGTGVRYGSSLNVTLLSGDIKNSSNLNHLGGIALNAARGNLTNTGSLIATGDIKLLASGDIYNGGENVTVQTCQNRRVYQDWLLHGRWGWWWAQRDPNTFYRQYTHIKEICSSSTAWQDGGTIQSEGGSVQIEAGGSFTNYGGEIRATATLDEAGEYVSGGLVSIIAAEIKNEALHRAADAASLSAEDMVITTADFLQRQAWLDEQLALAKEQDGLNFVIVQDEGTTERTYSDADRNKQSLNTFYYYDGETFCQLNSKVLSNGAVSCSENRQGYLDDQYGGLIEGDAGVYVRTGLLTNKDGTIRSDQDVTIRAGEILNLASADRLINTVVNHELSFGENFLTTDGAYQNIATHCYYRYRRWWRTRTRYLSGSICATNHYTNYRWDYRHTETFADFESLMPGQTDPYAMEVTFLSDSAGSFADLTFDTIPEGTLAELYSSGHVTFPFYTDADTGDTNIQDILDDYADVELKDLIADGEIVIGGIAPVGTAQSGLDDGSVTAITLDTDTTSYDDWLRGYRVNGSPVAKTIDTAFKGIDLKNSWSTIGNGGLIEAGGNLAIWADTQFAEDFGADSGSGMVVNQGRLVGAESVTIVAKDLVNGFATLQTNLNQQLGLTDSGVLDSRGLNAGTIYGGTVKLDIEHLAVNYGTLVSEGYMGINAGAFLVEQATRTNGIHGGWHDGGSLGTSASRKVGTENFEADLSAQIATFDGLGTTGVTPSLTSYLGGAQRSTGNRRQYFTTVDGTGLITGGDIFVTTEKGDLVVHGGTIMGSRDLDCVKSTVIADDGTETEEESCTGSYGDIVLQSAADIIVAAQTSEKVNTWTDQRSRRYWWGWVRRWNVTEYDISHDYDSATIAGGGKLRLIADQAIDVAASQLGGYYGAELIAGGDITIASVLENAGKLQDSLFYTDFFSIGRKGSKFQEMVSGPSSVQTLQGDLTMYAGYEVQNVSAVDAFLETCDPDTPKEDGTPGCDTSHIDPDATISQIAKIADSVSNIEIRGATIQSGRNLDIRANGGGIALNALTTEVHNSAFQRGFSGSLLNLSLSFSSVKGQWNSTGVMTSQLIANADLSMAADQNITGIGAYIAAADDLTITTPADVLFSAAVMDKYYREQGWSIGLSAAYPGKSVVDAMLSGQGLEGILEQYIAQNPLLSSMVGLSDVFGAGSKHSGLSRVSSGLGLASAIGGFGETLSTGYINPYGLRDEETGELIDQGRGMRAAAGRYFAWNPFSGFEAQTRFNKTNENGQRLYTRQNDDGEWVETTKPCTNKEQRNDECEAVLVSRLQKTDPDTGEPLFTRTDPDTGEETTTTVPCDNEENCEKAMTSGKGVALSFTASYSKWNSENTWQEATNSYLVAGGDASINASLLSLGGGTQFVADDDIGISAKQVFVEALGLASAGYRDEFGLSLGLSTTNLTPTTLTFSANASKSSSSAKTYSNAVLLAGAGCSDGSSFGVDTDAGDEACGILNMNVTGDFTVLGGNIHGEQVTLNIEGDLKLTSLQNTSKGESSGWGFNISYDLAENFVKGFGANVSNGSSDRAWVDRMASITSGDLLNITVDGKTSMLGSLLASGTNNLSLITNEFEFDHIENWDRAINSGFGFQISVPGAGEDANSPTINITGDGKVLEGMTYATIGGGTIQILSEGITSVNTSFPTLSDAQIAFLTQLGGTSQSSQDIEMAFNQNYQNWAGDEADAARAADQLSMGNTEFESKLFEAAGLERLEGFEVPFSFAGFDFGGSGGSSSFAATAQNVAKPADMSLFEGSGPVTDDVYDALAGLNRDVNAAQEITVDEEWVTEASFDLEAIDALGDQFTAISNLAKALGMSEEELLTLLPNEALKNPAAALDLARKMIAEGESLEKVAEFLATNAAKRILRSDLNFKLAAKKYGGYSKIPQEVRLAILLGLDLDFSSDEPQVKLECDDQANSSTCVIAVSVALSGAHPGGYNLLSEMGIELHQIEGLDLEQVSLNALEFILQGYQNGEISNYGMRALASLAIDLYVFCGREPNLSNEFAQQLLDLGYPQSTVNRISEQYSTIRKFENEYSEIYEKYAELRLNISSGTAGHLYVEKKLLKTIQKLERLYVALEYFRTGEINGNFQWRRTLSHPRKIHWIYQAMQEFYEDARNTGEAELMFAVGVIDQILLQCEVQQNQLCINEIPDMLGASDFVNFGNRIVVTVESALLVKFLLKHGIRFAVKRGSAAHNYIRNNCSCFVGDTPILMADGELKAISDVQIGELVQARNEFTGETSLQPITHKHLIAEKRIVELVIGDADGNISEVIKTTQTHPFWIVGKGWQYVGEIFEGDQLLRYGEDETNITLFVIEKRLTETFSPVYDLTVESSHTFFVGQSEIWVHNCKFDWKLHNNRNQSKWAGKNGSNSKRRHFNKHGDEFGARTADEYEQMAIDFASNPPTGSITFKGAFGQYVYDPISKTMFIGTPNSGKITTFYKFDGRIDDPAINMLINLGLLDPSLL